MLLLLLAIGFVLQVLGHAHASIWDVLREIPKQKHNGLTSRMDRLPAPPVEARRIVHENEWGVLSTINHASGVPFGNVLSLSDGPIDRSSGRPFFYMRSDDPTAQDARVNSNASLAVSEAQTGSCRQRHLDQEDPNCARLSMQGHLLEVPSAALSIAHDALFSRHPQMRDWPPNHHFVAFEFHVDAIRMLDKYGPHIDVSSRDYYEVDLDAISMTAHVS